MTKMKKESSNTSEVKSKSSNGKVIKAKNLETIPKRIRKVKDQSEPNESMDKKMSEVGMTPFIMKCMSKSTSTPMSVPGKVSGNGLKPGVNRLNSKVASPSRNPLSPILVDIDNVRDDEERKTWSTKRSDTRLSKIDEEDKPKKSLTRRRTFGIRRLFPVVDDKNEKSNEKIHFSENLRVRLCQTPSKVIDHATRDVSKRNHSRETSHTMDDKPQESTLVRNLRNDWSNSTLEETFLKTPQSHSFISVPKKQMQLGTKRLLTPLVEAIVEETVDSREDANKNRICDGGNYSSSAEFESDDEKENSRLKKAPTWKNLLTTSSDSRNINITAIRKSKRLRTLNSETQADEIPMQDGVFSTSNKSVYDKHASKRVGEITSDTQVPQLMEETSERPVNHSEVSLSRVEAIESENVTADGRKDLHTTHNLSPSIRLSRVRLRRSRQLLSLGSNKETHAIQDQDDYSQLPQEFETTNGSDIESQEHSRSERDDLNTQNIIREISSSPTLAQSTSQLVDENSERPVNQHEVSSSTAEELENENRTAESRKDMPTKRNLNSSERLPRVRLRRSKYCSQLLSLDSEKTHQGVQDQDVLSNASKTNLTNNIQVPQEIETIDEGPIKSQEPKNNERVDGNTQKILKEKSPLPLVHSKNLTNKSDAVEQLLNSPIYDDVEDATSPISECPINVTTTSQHSKKFFHSRIDNTVAVTKTADLPRTRASRRKKKNEDNVYDFLSQSFIDEPDPVADVIQKMISTGKVTVVKHRRCAGTVAPRKRKRNRKPKLPKVKDMNAKAVPSEKTQQLQQKQQNIPIVARHDDGASQFDDDVGMNHFDEDAEPRREQGSFSDLARSTMIKQAERNNKTPQRKMITDRRKLLSLAQKFVGQSTPVRPSAETTHIPRCSPMSGNKSPWRAADDTLPNTFYFGRNSDNLPSYSSDFIPMTQAENKSKSVSSFSSNDSNMENMAPPSERGNSQIEALPIPRRGLSNRSPLKAINIIDVVHLPPLVFDNTAKDISKENNQTISDRTLDKRKSQLNKTEKNETCASKTDLFGFEEIIDDQDDFTEASLNISAIPTKEDLKEKLQRLKRLRPEIPSTSASNPQPIRAVFDEPKTRQKSLRHMLCSTMIEKPRRGAQEIPKEQHDIFFNDGCDADLSNLFKDPEPETTFNESDSRRTYSRLYKTKRRKVRNNFVMFLDSDASDEEEEDKSEKRAKKRHKNEQRRNDNELNKFADEFNEMCKEVSQYQLIVE